MGFKWNFDMDKSTKRPSGLLASMASLIRVFKKFLGLFITRIHSMNSLIHSSSTIILVSYLFVYWIIRLWCHWIFVMCFGHVVAPLLICFFCVCFLLLGCFQASNRCMCRVTRMVYESCFLAVVLSCLWLSLRTVVYPDTFPTLWPHNNW